MRLSLLSRPGILQCQTNSTPNAPSPTIPSSFGALIVSFKPYPTTVHFQPSDKLVLPIQDEATHLASLYPFVVSALGGNGIPAGLLQLVLFGRQTVRRLTLPSLCIGCVTRTWKKVIIHPIPKARPGKLRQFLSSRTSARSLKGVLLGLSFSMSLLAPACLPLNLLACAPLFRYCFCPKTSLSRCLPCHHQSLVSSLT